MIEDNNTIELPQLRVLFVCVGNFMTPNRLCNLTKYILIQTRAICLHYKTRKLMPVPDG